MHEITPFVNTVSLVHGVESASGADDAATTEDEGSIASVSSSDNPSVNPGVLTNTKLDDISHSIDLDIDAIPDDKMSTKTSSAFTVTVTTPSSTFTTEAIKNNSETVSAVIYTSTTPISTSTVETDNSDSNSIIKNDSNIEQPPAELFTEKSITPKNENKKEDIAYDPDSMQGDSISSVYTYGAQKLQYLKLLAKLNAVSEELHIDLDEPTEEKEREKLHYDSGKPAETTKSTSLALALTTGFPITSKETPITSKSTEEIVVTTHPFVAPTEHVILTTPSPSETNTNPVNMTTSSPTPSITKDATVNMATESKIPDFTNAKHVMINLTISADNTENSYKPLYSLTVKVPTVGDSNEIPTVKITPIDAEPTQPTNFNQPIAVEGVTKAIKEVHTMTDFGGSCECSCPSCSSTDSPDDFYNDDYGSSTTTKPFDSTGTVINSTGTLSSTGDSVTVEYPTESDATENTLYTEDYLTDSTTDLTTELETESFSTTESPKFVCPKVKPPPILILEGEVTKYDINDKLLTFHRNH